MNRITVVIPTKNPILPWLRETLDSCAGVDEIIICNDASDTFEEGKCKFPAGVTHSIIHNPVNIGCFRTINRLCGYVKEGFISAQADDDYFDKDNFPKIQEIIRNSDADVVYFPCRYFGKYEGIFGKHEKVNYKELMQANYIYGASFFRKELFDFLGGFQLDVAADWDFWIRAAKSGAKFEFFPEVGAHFRVTKRSMFENSLAELGRAEINRRVQEHAHNWRFRYERKKVNLQVSDVPQNAGRQGEPGGLLRLLGKFRRAYA